MYIVKGDATGHNKVISSQLTPGYFMVNEIPGM